MGRRLRQGDDVARRAGPLNERNEILNALRCAWEHGEMFILVSFSPNTKRTSDDVRTAIAPFGEPMYSLPGGPLVMRCSTQDAAEDARAALVRLRKEFLARGKAFEFMWLRVNPTEFDYFPQRPKERPSWHLEVLREVFARDG